MFQPFEPPGFLTSNEDDAYKSSEVPVAEKQQDKAQNQTKYDNKQDDVNKTSVWMETKKLVFEFCGNTLLHMSYILD